jgi:hypothetical protein
MLSMFKRAAPAATDTSALGRDALALRVPSAGVVPQGCTCVVINKGGATRRIEAGGRIVAGEHETAYCFHPGPYSADLTPFAAAPELGLQVTFAIDCPDPRVDRQRFDLYLASEAGESVRLAGFVAAIEAALQRELAQGNLELPPCTSIDEWNQFRAGLNQLLYQRFGVTIEDCVPVDLGARVNYAQLLLERAIAEPASPPVSAPGAPFPAGASKLTDAQAMRRLFLELPGVTSGLRLAALPPGRSLFRQQQELLQRLDQVTLLIDTMPALALAAPGLALDQARQRARAQHSAAAAAALDEAWALLARTGRAPSADWIDDADRIVANLEHHAAGRRATA